MRKTAAPKPPSFAALAQQSFTEDLVAWGAVLAAQLGAHQRTAGSNGETMLETNARIQNGEFDEIPDTGPDTSNGDRSKPKLPVSQLWQPSADRP